MKKRKYYLAAMIPFLILVGLFEILPLFMVIVRSFMPENAIGLTLDHYVHIFSTRLYQQAVINSVLVSAVSSVIGIAVAYFGAKAVYEGGPHLKRFFKTVLSLTSNFAGIPLAFAYIILLGKVGVLVLWGRMAGISALSDFNLYSIWGLFIVYVYFQIPLATLLMIPSFDAIRREWKESVSLLGGSAFTFWRKVGLPALRSAILGTVSVLFANALAAYATAYALLQNNYSLIPIRLSEQFVGDITQHKEFGSALAVVLMVLMVALILINDAILKKGPLLSRTDRKEKESKT
jgi:putative spermidine/putrescine transport system permease protein